MQTKIYFFEVEESDAKNVRKKYPKAVCFAKPFSKKLAKKCADAEIICGMVHSDFSAEALGLLPNLKLVVTRSAGYDHIDLKFAAERKIPTCFVPEYGSHVIAEHVFALLLSSCRNILEGDERTTHENFSWCGLKGIALKNKTIGVIGTGRIGSQVCRIASDGFLMKVFGFDIYKNPELKKLKNFRYVSLDNLLRKSDFISLHLPLFPETQHLINAKTIAKMKDGVTLVNTARGGLIDTRALVAAIRKGKFTRVALDVIEHENNLREDRDLLHLPGVIITPHIAFYTDESNANMYAEAFRSIDEFQKNKKLTHRI
ncbi:hydroxyacid dehydrogenase [Patescibacteria group bacterium]|nr:hydroxyacid dehydrogenase [Patescibacteria group bacterium]